MQLAWQAVPAWPASDYLQAKTGSKPKEVLRALITPLPTSLMHRSMISISMPSYVQYVNATL